MARSTLARKPATPPPPRRKRRSSAHIMDNLLRAATAEFEENGFTGATTAAIARRADITEAQLFRYFATKADLFQAAVLAPLNQHLLGFLSEHVGDLGDAKAVQVNSRLYIAELQDFISEHSDLWMSVLVAQRYAGEGAQNASDLANLETYFERGAATMKQRLGGKAAKIKPEIMVRVSFAAVLACAMFKDWLFPRGLASDKDIRAAINEFVMEGVNANETPKKTTRRKSAR